MVQLKKEDSMEEERFKKDSYTKEELCELLNLDPMVNAQQLYYLTEYQKEHSMKGRTRDEITDWAMDEFGFVG